MYNKGRGSRYTKLLQVTVGRLGRQWEGWQQSAKTSGRASGKRRRRHGHVVMGATTS